VLYKKEDEMNIIEYYENCAEKISAGALSGITSLSQWEKIKPELHRRFLYNMGFSALPSGGGLRKKTGKTQVRNGVKIIPIGYEIYPDCWSSAVLFLPDPLPEKKLPTVLYASGHHAIGTWGYQPHALMCARRGYACCILDTIMQQDNRGVHHGLYAYDRWDWISMGYTACGAEALNTIRGLDALHDFSEIDTERIGSAGISGGGAHSFLIAALDPRIQSVATTSGVTDISTYVSYRHFLGHCDCMLYHNYYQTDPAETAALIAPRPVMFCLPVNDPLFTESGIKRLHSQVKYIYSLYGKEHLCRLFTYSGPHNYSAESLLQINNWFDETLSGKKHTAVPESHRVKITSKESECKEFSESELSIFNGTPPEPDRLYHLPELLHPMKSIPLPADANEYTALRGNIVETLRTQVFHVYFSSLKNERAQFTPAGSWDIGGSWHAAVWNGRIGGCGTRAAVFYPGEGYERVLVCLAGPNEESGAVMYALPPDMPEKTAWAYIEPRSTGLNSYSEKYQKEIYRLAAATGIFPVTMWMHDLCETLSFLRTTPEVSGKKIFLTGKKDAGVAALYYSIFDTGVDGLIADSLPHSHRAGGYMLNILNVLDIEHAAGLMAPRPLVLLNTSLIAKTWGERCYARTGCAGNYMRAEGTAAAGLRKIILNV